MTSSLRRLLSLVGLGERRRTRAEEDEDPLYPKHERQTTGKADSVDVRSGRIPLGYIPPDDDDRPRH